MTRFRGLFYKREDGMEKKKKGLNIRTSTKNGVKTKSVECSYGIKTEDGQRFTAILNRMESSDGNRGNRESGQEMHPDTEGETWSIP